ncbi:MAG: flagellum-specific ATP synthase [Candidatus Azotimanducaceae bacterium]|jgi:flagellum-specific ATP synthase
MTHDSYLDAVRSQLAKVKISRPIGRVSGVEGGVIHLSGIGGFARIGDRIEVRRADKDLLNGEVVQLNVDALTMLPDGALDGVALGDRATVHEPASVNPSESWIGRIIDPNGNAIDDRPLRKGPFSRPLNALPPTAAQRRGLGPRLSTGSAVFDTMLPLAKGQRIGLFAGSGVGKSTLIGQFAQNVDADVVVIAMIGERGREIRHFVDSVLGPEGLSRSIIIAATSDQSALIRRRCAWTAMTVAEYFRDQGKSVLLLADSITRFAEAHREIAVAAGEAPVLRGHPPSAIPAIMSLCERAGPGMETQGDITAVFSVLVAGSDMDEPVADILRGVLDGHVVLDRTIAERGRYPAVDLLRSISRSLPSAATDEQNQLISKVRKILGTYDRNEMMISAGLYSHGSDPEIDQAIQVWPELDSFMAKIHSRSIKDSFDQLGLIMRRAIVTKPTQGVNR